MISSGSSESVLRLALSTTKPITGVAKLVFATLFAETPAHRFVLRNAAQGACTAPRDCR